jgi:hypothetical protein
MAMVRWSSFRDMALLQAIVMVLLAFISTVRAAERPLSVFVFTATTAFMDTDAKQRTASVVDLRHALKDKKVFALATSRESADLLVEITGAGRAEADHHIAPLKYDEAPLGAGRSNSGDGRCAVDLTVSGGDYIQHFTNTDAPSSGRMCLGAASNLAGQLTTWTKDNRAQIVK